MSENSFCRISGQPLKEIMSFGKQPLGNGFLSPKQFPGEYFYDMSVGFCEVSKMFQLVNQPNPSLMFHDQYAFYSSTSVLMEKHFYEFYKDVISSGYIDKTKPFVVELGCNDGILLKNFSEGGISHLGIEPSLNVAKVANSKGVRTISEFFDNAVAKKIVDEFGQADVFLAANVMCHIPQIRDVVQGIKTILKPTGVIMFEDPYLGDVVKKGSYDQIYDEHVFLFSAHSIRYLFALYDLELIDVKPQETHGGSMRYILAHNGAYAVKDSVHELIESEKKIGIDKLTTFDDFKSRVEKSRHDLKKLLKELKEGGKSVAGYGATSKSTTILNYCNIGVDLIDFISDTTPIKQGKYTPGMHIPVQPYSEFLNSPPDYAVLFAWNHAKEIITKEQKFTQLGGQWIIHVPEVAIFK